MYHLKQSINLHDPRNCQNLWDFFRVLVCFSSFEKWHGFQRVHFFLILPSCWVNCVRHTLQGIVYQQILSLIREHLLFMAEGGLGRLIINPNQNLWPRHRNEKTDGRSQFYFEKVDSPLPSISRFNCNNTVYLQTFVRCISSVFSFCPAFLSLLSPSIYFSASSVFAEWMRKQWWRRPAGTSYTISSTNSIWMHCWDIVFSISWLFSALTCHFFCMHYFDYNFHWQYAIN